MKLTMVGTGYVGLVTGTCFANTGNDVVCLDVDPEKIKVLEEGGCPIYESGLPETLAKNIEANRLTLRWTKKPPTKPQKSFLSALAPQPVKMAVPICNTYWLRPAMWER